MTLFDAILSLVPNASFSIENNDYDTINWKDSRDKPTREEVEAEVTRLSGLEPMRLLRVERDKRLTACDWVVTMHKELGTSIPTAWSTYRQALRDLPSTASPTLDPMQETGINNVSWPTEPS